MAFSREGGDAFLVGDDKTRIVLDIGRGPKLICWCGKRESGAWHRTQAPRTHCHGKRKFLSVTMSRATAHFALVLTAAAVLPFSLARIGRAAFGGGSPPICNYADMPVSEGRTLALAGVFAESSIAACRKMRKAIVEPVFGQIKEQRGFRRFTLRGHQNVRCEWKLVCAASNLLKLFGSGWRPLLASKAGGSCFDVPRRLASRSPDATTSWCFHEMPALNPHR